MGSSVGTTMVSPVAHLTFVFVLPADAFFAASLKAVVSSLRVLGVTAVSRGPNGVLLVLLERSRGLAHNRKGQK